MLLAMRYIYHVLCVGLAVALVPYLLESGPWRQRIAIGVLIAIMTHGTLWGRENQ